MRMRARIVSVVVAAALGFAGACDDGPVPEPCSNIPAGGCPLSHGVACQDPACEAIYACRPGNVWELQARCSGQEAGVLGDGSTPPTEASTPVFDASIDAPPGAFGGPGCETLQTPDCALGVVLGCGGCCGCEDLYVCEDNGWTLWGMCGDGGIVRER